MVGFNMYLLNESMSSMWSCGPEALLFPGWQSRFVPSARAPFKDNFGLYSSVCQSTQFSARHMVGSARSESHMHSACSASVAYESGLGHEE